MRTNNLNERQLPTRLSAYNQNIEFRQLVLIGTDFFLCGNALIQQVSQPDFSPQPNITNSFFLLWLVPLSLASASQIKQQFSKLTIVYLSFVITRLKSKQIHQSALNGIRAIYPNQHKAFRSRYWVTVGTKTIAPWQGKGQL